MSDIDGADPAGACTAGVPEEDVAAWAVDGEPSAVTDLDAHAPTCPACQAVVRNVRRADGVAATLRSQREPAPVDVVDRALRRVRAERRGLLIARTIGGSFLRVAAVLPGYVAGTPEHGADPDDTVEFPGIGGRPQE